MIDSVAAMEETCTSMMSSLSAIAGLIEPRKSTSELRVMDILIQGAGFDNKGAEAMLRTVQREIGRRVPGACFHMLVSSLERQFAQMAGLLPTVRSSNREELLGSNLIIRGRRAWEFLHNADFRRAMMTSRGTAREILKMKPFDAIIDISGYAYGDAWNVGLCKDTWAWIEYCRKYNKPYIFLPQAWGPFTKNGMAKWARRLSEGASLLFVRDQESLDHLSSLSGKPSDTIRMAPDIVFRFQGAHPNVGSSILRDLGVYIESRPLFGIVPHKGIYKRTQGISTKNKYMQFLAKIANCCIDDFGASVVLLPNQINVPGKNGPDDRFLCGIIESQIKQNKYCFTIRDYHRSETIHSILSHLDLLIASRFHSLVFALSSGIPVIALGWSHKYTELLGSFGLSDYVYPDDQMDQIDIITMLTSAWRNRKDTECLITETLPIMQKEVDATFDLVSDLIRRT